MVNSELVEGPPVTEATAYTFIEPMYLMFSRSLAQSFVMIKDLQFSILWRDRENIIQSYEVFVVDDPQEVATTEHTLQSTKKDYYRDRETNGVWNYIEVLEASLVEKGKK